MGLFVLAVILSLIFGGVAFGVWKFFESSFAVLVTLIVGVAITGGIVLANWGANFHNEHRAVCTVTGKDRGGEDGSYRIYTEECGTLGNKDSLLRGKTNSADIWQQVEPGHAYELLIAGSRISLWSQFPNVFEVTPAK